MKNQIVLSIFTSLICLLPLMANAKKNCTKQPKEKWMKVTDFKEKLKKEGFTITKFKKPGSCYEIYGTNPDGQKVEIYFDPVTAKALKVEIDE